MKTFFFPQNLYQDYSSHAQGSTEISRTLVKKKSPGEIWRERNSPRPMLPERGIVRVQSCPERGIVRVRSLPKAMQSVILLLLARFLIILPAE